MKFQSSGSEIRAKWLANGWLRLDIQTAGGQRARRNESPDGFISAYEAAAALGWSPKRVYAAIAHGDLPEHPRGTRKGVKVADVSRLRRKAAA